MRDESGESDTSPLDVIRYAIQTERRLNVKAAIVPGNVGKLIVLAIFGVDTGRCFCEDFAAFQDARLAFAQILYSPSIMFRTILHTSLRCRLACFSGLAAAMFCLGCSGCAGWNWLGDGFQDDSLSSVVRKSRPPAKESEFSGLSAKARQIEADCGSQ